MRDLRWSVSERQIARRAHAVALESVQATMIAEFRKMAAAAATPSDLWAVEDCLRTWRRDLDDLTDYRYSQLLFVFARLIGGGYLDEAQLAGLTTEKLEIIRAMVSQSTADRRRS